MGDPRTVLVVDVEPAVLETLVSLLQEEGIRVRRAASADEALACTREIDFDAVLSDIRSFERNGAAWLAELRQTRPETRVILMTAIGSIDSAVDAMRSGAFDCITKPVNRGALLVSLERAFELRALEQENRGLRRALERALLVASGFDAKVGDTAPERPEHGLLARALEEQLSLRELSDLYTQRILELVHGNKVRAARILGINRRTLYRRGEGRHREAFRASSKETN